MKKQRFFMLGIITVLVAVLSLTFVSSTFAKYTTSGSASDSARVAKWGVTINATDDGDSKNVLDTVDSQNEAEIAVNKELKLLAPGTKGQLVTVSVSGTPEVAVNVTVEFSLTLANWDSYMPLVFTAIINGETKTYKVGDGGFATADALIAQLKQDIKAEEGKYDENSDLSNTFDLQLSWEWAYSTSADNDVKDTALGDQATAPTLVLSYSITVEQAN